MRNAAKHFATFMGRILEDINTYMSDNETSKVAFVYFMLETMGKTHLNQSSFSLKMLTFVFLLTRISQNRYGGYLSTRPGTVTIFIPP